MKKVDQTTPDFFYSTVSMKLSKLNEVINFVAISYLCIMNDIVGIIIL